MALTRQAEVATTRAAKIGGTRTSIADSWKSFAGKHMTSDGSSAGTLTNKRWLGPQAVNTEDVGDMAHMNAISGDKAATPTVAVRRAVHTPAYNRRGRLHDRYCERRKVKRDGDILTDLMVLLV